MEISSPSSGHEPEVITVSGKISVNQFGLTDAHNHVWIEKVDRALNQGPILNQKDGISTELIDYRLAGGSAIVDCQPGGCGRNGNRLRELSSGSGVMLMASTGYHLRKYYPPDYWLFQASEKEAARYFYDELTIGLSETRQKGQPVLAGLIKIACEDSLEKSPLQLMQAAVEASLKSGCAILVHTEKGASAERIALALQDFGLPPGKLVLCHMDKRPDFALHQTLAQEGILLEYDTFFRPQYNPEEGVWPLLESMLRDGLEGQIALAADMAEKNMWRRLGGGPGLTGLSDQVLPKLKKVGFSTEAIAKLSGGNIIQRLARSSKNQSNPER
jgi:5-phospho-D-xylono-1,4-lactonase